MNKSMKNVKLSDINMDEYLQGQTDCKNGVIHEAGKHADYDFGFSMQYQHEQNLSEASERKKA